MADWIAIEVAYPAADGMRVVQLQMPASATIEDALSAMARALGLPADSWDHAAVGIYGRLAPRQQGLNGGDRVEIYPPLKADPKALRRARAQRNRY